MTPDAFAAVMATGIVSIAADDHGYPRISGGLGVLVRLVLSPISHVVFWIGLGSWAIVAVAGLSLLGHHLRRRLPSKHGLR